MVSTKTIGLVGGVASGKSRVAQMLVEMGAGLLDADRAGHDALAEDAEVQNAIRSRWGDTVFAADGSVDRAAVARRVFAQGPAAEVERRFLEGLLHPRIGQRLAAQHAEFLADGRIAVVLDAALLFEANWRPLCDLAVFVDAPRDVRLERARRRGWSDAEFNQREAAQWTVDEKRRHADVVISNSGSELELLEQVRGFWTKYIGPVG